MGKNSDFPRRKNDAYLSWDIRTVLPLLPHLAGWRSFVEPCAGAGHLVDHLQAAGLHCVQAYDIAPQRADIELGDAMAATLPPGADGFITNPVWTRQLMHPMLVHLAELAPTWFLLDAGWAFGKQARPYLERYCHLIVAGNRVKWIEESEHDATDDLAWYLFARGAPGRPTFVPRG